VLTIYWLLVAVVAVDIGLVAVAAVGLEQELL
jgi:hypothetical protein